MKKKINTPSIITKIYNFTKSLYNHIVTGMQKSSYETIDYRYGICEGCEFFQVNIENNEVITTCNVCGCALSKKKIFMNKLAWKDQKCPEGKW